MAQIIVCHSAKDRELIDVLARAFAVTKVKAIYEEFEEIQQVPRTRHAFSDISANRTLCLLSWVVT
jgi:hypothetical protein